MAANLIISIIHLSYFLIFIMLIINHSASARALPNPPSPPPTATFFMPNPLTKTKPSRTPAATAMPGDPHLPFPKPVGFFPPKVGIPLPDPNPGAPASPTTQTLDLSGIGLSFPAVSTLQELEFGTALVIEEDLFDGAAFRPSFSVVGKARGMYVASSEENGSSHMAAITASFAGGDSLRFFGVVKEDAAVRESHIAVIGGSGKYDGANGYATVVEASAAAAMNASAEEGSEGAATTPLLFNVYLSS